jgi:hypothetical protein
MNLDLKDVSFWDTRLPLGPEFAAAWTARTARSPHASFDLRPDFLAWEARHGRPAMAVLVEDPAALMVVRRVGGGWECGWPWRLQITVESPSPGLPAFPAAQRHRLLAALHAVTRGARTRCYLPEAPGDGEPAFEAGTTFMHALERGEDELFGTLDTTRRRMVRKAANEGFEVVEAHTLEQFRSFAQLQAETEQRRGRTPAPVPEHVAESGESWREWELPWMQLLVAVREGQVVAGSGFGFSAGSMVDYRTNASKLEVRRYGVNIALAWEALRRSRTAGARWLNWGGSTEFKRTLGGAPMTVWCQLGGGPVWALPNQMTLSWHRMRPEIAGLWKSLRRRGAPS